MDILTSVEAVAATLAISAVVVVAFVFARRRRIAKGGALLVCAIRTRAEPEWRLGLLRLGETMDWFSVVGPTTRPELSWRRDELDVGAPAPMTEVIPGIQAPVLLRGGAGRRSVDLAMAQAGATTLRVWLESSPPTAPSAF